MSALEVGSDSVDLADSLRLSQVAWAFTLILDVILRVIDFLVEVERDLVESRLEDELDVCVVVVQVHLGLIVVEDVLFVRAEEFLLVLLPEPLQLHVLAYFE